MKKVLFLLMLVICLCGCEKEEVKIEETTKPDVQKEEVETYKDLNQTPIGIYSLNGNQLTRLTTITKKPVIEEDLGVFQIYPMRIPLL